MFFVYQIQSSITQFGSKYAVTGAVLVPALFVGQALGPSNGPVFRQMVEQKLVTNFEQAPIGPNNSLKHRSVSRANVHSLIMERFEKDADGLNRHFQYPFKVGQKVNGSPRLSRLENCRMPESTDVKPLVEVLTDVLRAKGSALKADIEATIKSITIRDPSGNSQYNRLLILISDSDIWTVDELSRYRQSVLNLDALLAHIEDGVDVGVEVEDSGDVPSPLRDAVVIDGSVITGRSNARSVTRVIERRENSDEYFLESLGRDMLPAQLHFIVPNDNKGHWLTQHLRDLGTHEMFSVMPYSHVTYTVENENGIGEGKHCIYYAFFVVVAHLSLIVSAIYLTFIYTKLVYHPYFCL